jgi:DNA-binding NtrC family response regulator
MASRVLIVDDDPLECRLLEGMVRALGHACESVGGGEAALARLGASSAPQIAAMILDLVMPDLDGMAVLERLGRRSLWVPVIVQTANGGAEAAVSAMRAGAFDFVVKPVAAERLRVSLTNALKVGALAGEVSRMSRSRAGTLEFADIVMRSPPMERVRDLGRRAARLAVPVLIEGETGTGKEIFARAIHGSGPRRTRPFVSVNCAAIASDAAETVLFGEADVGSGLTKAGGKLKEAQGGTLFLDEVGALPSSAQRRLVDIVQGEEAPPPGINGPVGRRAGNRPPRYRGHLRQRGHDRRERHRRLPPRQGPGALRSVSGQRPHRLIPPALPAASAVHGHDRLR